MKPAPFTYHDPRSVADALGLLATHDNARALAGGQSLMPAMNFRYAMPDHLIDLNRIAELGYIREKRGDVTLPSPPAPLPPAREGSNIPLAPTNREEPGTDSIELGAMTRQRELEFSDVIAKRCPVIQAALAHVGHRQTRNRGTIGGSLCHLDPSAELLNAAALLDARFTLASVRGTRTLSIDEFAVGYMTTALAPDELLTGITLTMPAADTRHGFVEFARRHGDFSIVACSALLSIDARGLIGGAALAISGLVHAPVRPTAIERALVGQPPNETTFRAAAAEAQKLDANGDTYTTAAYRQHLARVLTFRVLQQAAQRAGH